MRFCDVDDMLCGFMTALICEKDFFRWTYSTLSFLRSTEGHRDSVMEMRCYVDL